MCYPKSSPKQFLRCRPLIALGLCLVLAGCAHYNAINFVTSTQFGVKVGVNAEKIPEIQIGYNRQEAARVPVYLMTSEDGLSASPPAINAILVQAERRIIEAVPYGGDASSWPTHGKPLLSEAETLINDAVELDKPEKSPQGKSELLRRIQANARKIVAQTTPSKQELKALSGLIQAEIDKPRLFAEFEKQAKFIGSRNGRELEDAYSVLGTFRGSGSGSVSSNGAHVKIAQYFATGVAAQLLAEQGGAALVNPAAAPSSSVDPAQVAADVQRNLKTLEDVAKWITKTQVATEQKLRFKQALKDLQAPEETERLFKDSVKPKGQDAAKSAEDIATWLSDKFGTQTRTVEKIVKNMEENNR